MESSDLFQWMKIIGLADYCKQLWTAGFNDLASITSLTEDQLKRAGIKKAKICSRLLQECDKLKSGKVHFLFVELGDIQLSLVLDESRNK